METYLAARARSQQSFPDTKKIRRPILNAAKIYPRIYLEPTQIREQILFLTGIFLSKLQRCIGRFGKKKTVSLKYQCQNFNLKMFCLRTLRVQSGINDE